MRRRFSFHPIAEQELNEAAAYYEAESHGLGSAFLKEVEKAVQQVLNLSRIRSHAQPSGPQESRSKIPVQRDVLGHSDRYSDPGHCESETPPLLLVWT